MRDLLFLEEAIILAFGIFIAVMIEWERAKLLSETSKETAHKTEEIPEKGIDIDVLMMVFGAVLIGLSIIVGVFLH